LGREGGKDKGEKRGKKGNFRGKKGMGRERENGQERKK